MTDCQPCSSTVVPRNSLKTTLMATLAIGDACSVTKAGKWCHDGVVHKVNEDGTYNVYLQDDKITLTNKPSNEVKVATMSREQRMAMAVVEAVDALHSPQHETARAVRLNQSRTCCGFIILLALSLASLGAYCFVIAFSLMPAGGVHPAGMCELCVHHKYRGRVCTFWPETSPRCHEHFMAWIYSGAFVCSAALIPLIFLVIGLREALGALGGTATLGESRSMTFEGSVYPMCDSVFCFTRPLWCCGDELSERELQSYDRDESAVRQAHGKFLIEGISPARRGMV